MIEIEGGYVNDASDSGGETKYGISKRAYPNLDIKNLTVEQAAEIYERDYYRAHSINLIEDEKIRWQIFKAVVNMNALTAIRMLQKVCNVKQDGIIGNITLNAINKDVKACYEKFTIALVKYYCGLKQEKFISGWLRRILFL